MRTCELIWGTARPVAARGWAKSNPEFGNLIAPQKGEHSTSSISAVGYSQLMARMLPSAAGFHVPTTTNQSESYHSPAVRGRLIASPGYLTSHRLADLVLHSAGGRGTSHSGSQKVLLESLLGSRERRCLSGVLVHHCLAAAARIPRVTSSPMPSASEPGPARVLASRKLAEAIRLRNTAGIKNRHRRPPPADPRELGRSERTTSDESLGLVGWLFGPNRPMYRWTARGPGEDVHLSPLPIIRSSRRPVTGTLFEGEVLLGGVPFGCRR